MGSFANNVITDAGRILHADCLAGAVFTPTRIVIGSGTLPSGTAIASLTAVITPVKSLTINKAQRTPDGKCIFGGVYSNKDVTQDFYFRELALYAKGVYLNDDGTVRSETAETLYSYGNAGSTADLMRAYSTEHVVERQMDLVCWVGNTAKVNLTIASDVYVTREQIADMGAHMKNTHNPHEVTAAQVGLGDVDNTADLDKPVSTAQEAAIAEAKKAGTDAAADLAAHAINKDNPHQVTAAQVGADPKGSAQSVKTELQTALNEHTADKENPHGVTAAQVGADVSGAAAAVQGNLDTHTANKSNPHNVTCDQIGAIKTSTLGKPNGPAKLDADGILTEDQLPPVSGSLITITFESAFQGATWTLTGGGENYSGVVDSSLKAVVSVKDVNTLYMVSAAVSGTTYTAEITTLNYFTALALALTRFHATITVTVDSGSTVTAVCGSAALTKTSTGTAVFTVGKAGTWTITASKDGETATGTVEITASGQSKSLALDYAAVFGVVWDTSNSSTALTRLTPSTDPYGYVTKSVTTEPKPAVGTGSGSSPFDEFMPWSGMQKMTMDGNIMVFIPAFHVAYKENGTKKYFYISDKAKTGFAKHPGSGKYVGRYHMNSSGKSLSGQTPYVNITRATARSRAKSLGSKYHLYDFATYCAIIWLYLIEFADWNCQSKIGRGYVDDNSSAANSGMTDYMLYHTANTSADGKGGVQYRWIENLWGNVSQWIDGLNIDDRTVYCCTDPSKYADDTTTGYTQIGILPSAGWIKDLTVTNNGLLTPSESGGSSTTYITDYLISNVQWCVPLVGGSWLLGSQAGFLYSNMAWASDGKGAEFTARLACEA